ncbi:deSI-like protein At4g17486 isoform X1 [Musa acuminata AAA Group]|uniref:deSI-like protein At4g17486 isoform X1 n=1 Tax=Musa acuminata AAA Group TaxID=214697 RepID=UPI0008A0CF4B|nr:PREDICTED: deSI-like protein At4g17486 isoform X2 [Musa acuminata subsp. malaccensis]
MLLWLDRRSCSHFCMFPKVWSASHTPGNALVYLNVYDLPPMNGFMYWAGLGIFHTGVEVHGVEYVFGAHDYPSSGVFEVREFMELQSVNYSGDTYHLIMKNCNHFCKEICHKMTVKCYGEANFDCLYGLSFNLLPKGTVHRHYNQDE